jgi:trk system potassium uptake protein TrkH
MGSIDFRPILFVIGWLLAAIAIAMLVPMGADIVAGHPDWQVFAASSVCTLFFGVLILLSNRTAELRLSLRQTFLLTTSSWVVVCAFAALPFAFSEIGLDYTDAFFEAMSGLTTTGSTVIVGLDAMAPGILLWRAVLNWLGGVGIVAMGIVILPFLRVGGMQLFRSESSDKAEKVVPRAGDLAIWVGWIYVSLTALSAVALALAGMSPFDAVCNAMAALATGGFSTRDASIGAWASPAVEWVATASMFVGALPFIRYISLIRGDASGLLGDSQVRRFAALTAAVSLAMAVWLGVSQDIPFADALRLATFNVVSVVTTTGFASADYSLWGPPALAAFFFLTYVGGCTGSTAGGIKVLRFEILALVLRQQLTRLYSPHRVLPLTYGEKPVDADVMISVAGFVFVYFATIGAIALVLGAMGLDLVTAVTGASTAVSNVGPGLGEIIGPAGNFAPLPDGAKWVLSAGMLLGRLELFTVLVLLNPRFWRA